MGDYEKLIEKFGNPEPGAPRTYEYLIEECAELIQAIQHYKRKRSNAIEHLVEEMAHVYTLLDSTCVFMSIDKSHIDHYKNDLIRRYIDQPNDGRHCE